MPPVGAYAHEALDMAYYRITACGARGDKWNVVPVGFAVRRCSQSPNVPCCPSQAGGECPYFSSTCRELAYFGFARHGEDKAWQMAVDKIRELNPRGDIAQGRTMPTLQNLSGKQHGDRP